MERSEFKKRMQSLKSYREQNPGKGYWDWKEDIPEYKDGGIHIKPENRGKFTRLKERTGKSATWFKQHGTPEQKKMATFALNARKWKHADGGEIEETYTRPIVNADLIRQQASNMTTDEIMALQNERQKEYAKWWYTERAKQAKYASQLGNGQLQQVLKNIDQSTYVPFDNLYMQEYTRQNPNIKLDNFTRNTILQEGRRQYQGLTTDNGQWTSRAPTAGKFTVTSWHEGIGHVIGDRIPSILNAADSYRAITIPKSDLEAEKVRQYDKYRNQANEKHAETWGFRGANINLKDDKGNYYIDPNRQLTGDDIREMINKGAIIPSQFEGLTPEQIADRHNRFAYTNTASYSIPMTQDGGEIPPELYERSDYQGSNDPVYVNPFTGKPLATGAITPVFNLEDFVNFTPAGDVLSVRDAFIAAKNRDLIGLGLAGLGVLPYIPTVNRNHFAERFAEMEKRDAKKHEMLDDFFNQRNSVYEDLIENEEAYRRAANADRISNSNYRDVYSDMIRQYGKGNMDPNLVQPATDRALYATSTKAQVDPQNLDYIFLNPRYADPDELETAFQRMNPGLIRHEMGHIVDEKAGLDYTNRLSDPNKFVSDEQLKLMFPKSHKRLRNEILNRGSEIKSYMNEFRDFLMNKHEYNDRETVNGMRKKLDRYNKQFPVLNKIYDSYKSKKQFVKDYNSVPLTATESNKTVV